MKTKIKPLFFMLFVMLLACSCFISIVGTTKASAEETNYTVVTILATNNSPYKKTEVELAGKIYTTDENGKFKTDNLPFGSYTVKPRIKDDENGVWDYTLYSQKVSISRVSHFASMQDFNRIYVYKKFNLNISIVNANNIPIKDMAIAVYKNDLKVMTATVTTCVLGNITFDWQEMPNNSGGEYGIFMGDELEVRAEYKGNFGNYKSVSKIFTLDSPLEYVKLISYKDGETASNAEPSLYNVENYKTVEQISGKIIDKNNAAMLVFDLGLKKQGDSNAVVLLDKTMFKLYDSNGSEIQIINATLRLNNVILEYPLEIKDIESVSYTKANSGYLVSELNELIAVKNFIKVNVAATKDNEELMAQFEDEVVRLVNDERTRAGRSTLEVDENLRNMARIKSKDMKFNAYLAHKSPNMGWFYEQIKMFNYYDYTVLLENIASMPMSKTDGSGNGELTPQEAANAVFNGWKNSPGHYENMLSRDVNWIGVGYNIGGLWTQLFAKNRSDETVKISAASENFYGSAVIRYSGLVGKVAEITASPHEGYSFEKWIDKTTRETISLQPQHSFIVGKQHDNQTFVAIFKKSGYNFTTKIITFKNVNGKKVEMTETGGTVTGAGDYNYGDKVKLSAKSNKLFEFYGWYNGDVSLDTLGYPNFSKPDYNIVAGGDDKNIKSTAVFKRVEKAVLKIVFDKSVEEEFGTPIDIKLNDIQVSGISILAEMLSFNGKTIDLAKFEEGSLGLAPSVKSYNYVDYIFVHWKNANTGEILPEVVNGMCKLYITSSEMVITPVFKIKEFEVTALIPNKNGVVLGVGIYKKHATPTVTAVADKGFKFSHWGTDTTDTNAIKTLDKLTSNVELKPIFIIKDSVEIITSANFEDVGYLTPSSRYFMGEAVTLIAAIKDPSYKFIGWYNKDEKVSSNQIYSFIASKNDTYEARYENQAKKFALKIVNDEQKGGVSAYINGKKTDLSDLSSIDSGSEIRLETTVKTGYNFLSYTDKNREVSIVSSYTFTLLSDSQIIVNYIKTQSYIVMFVDNEGKVVLSQEVAAGGNAEIPTNLNKAGYTFLAFDVDDTLLKNVNQNLIVNILYVRTSGINIVVTNGKIADDDGSYSIGDKIKLISDKPPLELNFSHWTKNGEIISYESQLTIIIDGDAQFQAQFVSNKNDIVKKVIVELSNKVYENDKLTFYAKTEIDSSLEMLECGMILVKASDNSDELNHETAGAIIVKSYAQSSTGQFYVSKSSVTSQDEYSAVAYIIYKDAEGNILTAYSSLK